MSRVNDGSSGWDLKSNDCRNLVFYEGEMMTRNVLTLMALVGLVAGSTVEAQDYGRVVIKPRNARIGAILHVRNPSTKPAPEWVQDPVSQRLGLWSPTHNKFIVVFVPTGPTDPASTEAVDYGSAKIRAKNPRMGSVPKPRTPSTKPAPEWVKDQSSENLGLWSPSSSRFLVVFTPSSPAMPMTAPPVPVNSAATTALPVPESSEVASK